MNTEAHLADTKEKMQKTLEKFQEDLASVRTGRANATLLDNIKVDAYGTKMGLRDLASVSAPEPRLLVLQVWDSANIAPVELAIRNSDLAVNPVTENNIIRIPIPPLSEERRREMTKLVQTKAEAARVSIRQIRRDGVEKINTAEKSKEISEDEKFTLNEKVQKTTEELIHSVDNVAKQKETEVLSI